MVHLAVAVMYGAPDGPLPSGGSGTLSGLDTKIKSGPAVALPNWSDVTDDTPSATVGWPTKGLLVDTVCALAACWAACNAA